MDYSPAQPHHLWDTWLSMRAGTLHAFYLHLPPGDGVGHATSQDGRTWTEEDLVIALRAPTDWIGSGSVWETQGGFAMNFSESLADRQRIRIAVSDDLESWTVDERTFDPDPARYRTDDLGRWDCMNVIPDGAGGFMAFFTATPLDGVGIGRAVSADGVEWTAVDPPVIEWGNRGPSGLHDHMEVGGSAAYDGAFWLVLCGMGFHGDIQGAYLLRSDRPAGPYSPAGEDPTVLACRVRSMSYFPRLWTHDGEIIVNHHSIDHTGNVWLAPLKVLRFDEVGPRLSLWADTGSSDEAAPLIAEQVSTRIATASRETAPLLSLDPDMGIDLSVEIEVEPFDGQVAGAGLLLPLETGDSLAIVCRTNGTTTFHEMDREERQTWLSLTPKRAPQTRVGVDSARGGIAPTTPSVLRVLARSSMLEIYLDDLLEQVYTAPSPWTGDILTVCEEGDARFTVRSVVARHP